MNAPRVGVGVMIVRDGRVLMGRRMSGQRPGWWGWIGGKLEFGETLTGRPVESATSIMRWSIPLACRLISILRPDSAAALKTVLQKS